MKVGDKSHRAMLGVVHAVILSDGEINSSKLARVVLVARKHASFRRWSDEDFAITCAAVLDEWNGAPRKKVIDRWVETLSKNRDLAGETFALAIDAVLSDGEFADIEGGMLLYLARAWNISDRDRELEYKFALERKANRPAEG